MTPGRPCGETSETAGETSTGPLSGECDTSVTLRVTPLGGRSGVLLLHSRDLHLERARPTFRQLARLPAHAVFIFERDDERVLIGAQTLQAAVPPGPQPRHRRILLRYVRMFFV